VAALADRLAARTLELVDIPSESLQEAEIREHLRALVPPVFEPAFAGDDAFLWVRRRQLERPLVVLVGHYDTIPAQGNLPGRIEGGSVHGAGASDMKGGVAVALELVRDLASEEPGSLDVALLLFGREELPPDFSPLPELFERTPLVREAALAVILEPTDGTVQAGCVGNLNARLVFHGTSAHSARPWLGENAIERAIEGLAPVVAHERREVVIADLPFYEVLSVTRLEAGIADNVIPDRAVATLNFRYAPDRTPEEAVEHLRSLTPAGAELVVVGDSPPARVAADAPLVQALLSAGARGIEPKQAWTNVADFTSRGIDAVNFGPGHTHYAHRRDELVRIDALVHAYETLRRFLGGAS
jgi:succinyl-diaminopimelate desuccinylase